MYNIQKKSKKNINMTRIWFGNNVHMNEIVLMKEEAAVVRLVTRPVASKKQKRAKNLKCKKRKAWHQITWLNSTAPA